MSHWLGLPFLASQDGATIDLSLVLIHALMLAMLLGWGAVFVIALLRFRKSRHPHAVYADAKGRAGRFAEAGVAVVEAALLVGISIPFWAANVNALPGPEQNPFEVRVVAQQFVWNVHYPGPDGVFGPTELGLVDDKAGNPVGLDRGGAHAQDDVVVINQLHVPVNRPVVVHLSSKDVVHGFHLPELRVKRDAIPGMTIAVPFTPTVTTAQFRDALRVKARRDFADAPESLDRALKTIETRDYEIACAQLCGINHFNMRGVLVVETEDELNRWLAEKAKQNTVTSEEDFWK